MENGSLTFVWYHCDSIMQIQIQTIKFRFNNNNGDNNFGPKILKTHGFLIKESLFHIKTYKTRVSSQFLFLMFLNFVENIKL